MSNKNRHSGQTSGQHSGQHTNAGGHKAAATSPDATGSAGSNAGTPTTPIENVKEKLAADARGEAPREANDPKPDASAPTPTGVPSDHPAASLPVGVAGSLATRKDVPDQDLTPTAQGGDAKLNPDGSVPAPKLGVDEDEEAAVKHIAALPIGVAGNPLTRADIADGDPTKPAGAAEAEAAKKTGPDQPYRLAKLTIPVVDMHGYARREMYLSSENADTLRDIAAGLASVGEKLDGSLIDRPEKALDWLLRRVREEIASDPERSEVVAVAAEG